MDEPGIEESRSKPFVAEASVAKIGSRKPPYIWVVPENIMVGETEACLIVCSNDPGCLDTEKFSASILTYERNWEAAGPTPEKALETVLLQLVLPDPIAA